MSQKINSLSDYIHQYEKSIKDPEKFWGELAATFSWQKPWENILNWDFKGPNIKWFEKAKLNITENIFERQLKTHSDKIAIIWEPNEPEEKERKITYRK